MGEGRVLVRHVLCYKFVQCHQEFLLDGDQLGDMSPTVHHLHHGLLERHHRIAPEVDGLGSEGGGIIRQGSRLGRFPGRVEDWRGDPLVPYDFRVDRNGEELRSQYGDDRAIIFLP